jgi:tripartite-type tricarboxylate transporter receptor subunit TctC
VQARTCPSCWSSSARTRAKLNYGSAGNGTSHHLAGELFKLQTKTFITHIPYRGAGPALQDLIAGQVDLMFDGLGSSAAHIKGGRLKAIAVAADKPAPGFPEIPLAKAGGARLRGVHLVRAVGAQGHAQGHRRQDGRRNAQGAGSDELRATWTGLGTETPNLYGDNFGRSCRPRSSAGPRS